MWTPKKVHWPSLRGSECLRPSSAGSTAAAWAPPAFPAPLLREYLQENREGCEGGGDSQTPRDSPGLQEMKTFQDLTQGSREGVREAAGAHPPIEGLVGGSKGFKAAARAWAVIWLQLQGGTGLLSLLKSTCHGKNEPSWNPPALPNKTKAFAPIDPHFPLVSSS